jgi:excisionase family DNA binding protein
LDGRHDRERYWRFAEGLSATVGDMADPQLLGDVLAAEPLLLTPEEAAKVLRVGRTTVYALMKAGDLHPVHIGRSCRISRAELERYVCRLDSPQPSALPQPRRQRRTNTNQHSLFEFSSDPVDRA